MTYPILQLKPGSDMHLRGRHHAIYKAAIAAPPKAEDGAIVEVRDATGNFLCYAHWNSQAFICGRAIAFERGDPIEQMRYAIESALALRKRLFTDAQTTAYRLINAEGDGLPGLIVDRYGDVLTVQLTTLGMDRLRSWVATILQERLRPAGIFEKSTGGSRAKEGLEPIEGWLRGEAPEPVRIVENGMQFDIALTGSQKTGLFLDQRDMRQLVRSMAKGKTVLDCCSYVGGFSVAALLGGALSADAVDYDAVALSRAKASAALNGIDPAKLTTYAEDVFNVLRRRPLPRPYDFVILDPPAFAKGAGAELETAKRAYTDLNRLGMEILPREGGLLLTCSCSYQMNTELFQSVVLTAARQARRTARILQRHRHAMDHPVNMYHPETDYLKSLLLWVE